MNIIKNIMIGATLMLSLPVVAQKFVGGDISLLPSYEQKGAKYYDASGNAIPALLPFLAQQGWNAQRVRLFVDPSKAPAEKRAEGAVQDLDYVTALGKRIKDTGHKFMLDLHYSDTWTDPGQHAVPVDWTSASPTELVDKVYSYTKSTLQHLVAAGATPDFIQPGNEITYGMLWPTGRCYPTGANYGSGTFENFARYLKAAIRACREVCPEAKIVVHTEMSFADNVPAFYNTLKSYTDDYDIIGLSYYPDYHGSLSTLNSVLTRLETNHPSKKIMIVETGYGSQWQLPGSKNNFTSVWPLTEQGQAKFASDLIALLNNHASVTGLFWWMPEDNEAGVDWHNPVRSTWWNGSLFNQSTGRVLGAMQILRTFLGGSNEVSHRFTDKSELEKWFTPSGQAIVQPVRSGIYITQGRKIFIPSAR